MTSAATSGLARTRRQPTAAIAWWIGIVVALTVLVLVRTANPALALWPLLVALTTYAVIFLPVRWTILAFVALTILGDVAWGGPTEFFFDLFINNLNKLTGIEALHFSGADVCVVVLSLVVAVRIWLGSTIDGPVGDRGGAAPMFAALAIASGMLLYLETMGILRDGDVRQSLYQFHQMLTAFILAALLIYSLRTPRDLAPFVWVLTLVGAVKVGIGIYYTLAVVRPGEEVATATSHADTVVFVVVIAIWAGLITFRPTVSRIIVGTLVAAWMIVGIQVNHRRTAFVSVIATLVVLAVMQPPRTRRILRYALIGCIPLIVVYFVIAQSHPTGIFAPAANIMSVTQQKDASSKMRDIEDFNLLVTLRPHQLLGTGFGQMYVEMVKAYDISDIFAQYRYLPHNSVLWLWSAGGLIGFTAIWLPIYVAVFLAARSHRIVRSADERAAAYVTIAICMAVIVQCWADLGMSMPTPQMILAFALAGSATLARTAHVWPSRIRLWGNRDGRPSRAHARPRLATEST